MVELGLSQAVRNTIGMPVKTHKHPYPCLPKCRFAGNSPLQNGLGTMWPISKIVGFLKVDIFWSHNFKSSKWNYLFRNLVIVSIISFFIQKHMIEQALFWQNEGALCPHCRMGNLTYRDGVLWHDFWLQHFFHNNDKLLHSLSSETQTTVSVSKITGKPITNTFNILQHERRSYRRNRVGGLTLEINTQLQATWSQRPICLMTKQQTSTNSATLSADHGVCSLVCDACNVRNTAVLEIQAVRSSTNKMSMLETFSKFEF